MENNTAGNERERNIMGTSEYEHYMTKLDRYCVFLQYWIVLNIILVFMMIFWHSTVDFALILTLAIVVLIFHALLFRKTIFMLFDTFEAWADLIATFIPFVGILIVVYNLDECRNRMIKDGHTFKLGRLHNVH